MLVEVERGPRRGQRSPNTRLWVSGRCPSVITLFSERKHSSSALLISFEVGIARLFFEN